MSRGDRSRPGRERTAEERERDRLERERRRGAAARQPPEDSPAQERAGAPQPPPESADPPAPVEPLAHDPPTVEHVPAEASPPLEYVPPEAPPPLEYTPADPPPLEYAPSDPLPPVEDAPPSPVEHLQPPVPLESLAPPVPSVTGAQAPPGASVRVRRGRSPFARVAAVLALAAVIAALVALLSSHDPKHAAPPAPPPVVKVLIAEGKTRVQIAQIAAADGLKGDYRVASRRSPLLSPAAYGAPHGTPNLEGFLFPATYDMDKGAPVSRLVEEQLAAFQENFGVSDIARAHALHVTPYQLLTVASMVEREAQIPGDRPKIAAVIYNRLAAGMPLGIDASIYYAVELASGIATYTRELTEAQLHIDSPYNTRTHVGLPPTPISNPGLASIEAAAHPAHVSYLYYVAGADGCGEQVFSHTLAEFEANAAAYKAAVARAGGHPPTCKRK